MKTDALLTLLTLIALLPSLHGNSELELKKLKAALVKKHLKRLKKQDGAIKLVGGRGEFEGKYYFCCTYLKILAYVYCGLCGK